jgi:signal transduction histidine kinase
VIVSPRHWTFLSLGLGLVAIWWGLWRLERIFIEERSEALAKVTAESDTLAEYARRTLEGQLETAAHAAEEDISAALADPLHPAPGVLAWEDGRQLLPRRDAPVPKEVATARDLYAKLRAADLPVLDDATSPWAHRVRLFALLARVLRDGEREPIIETVREILRHRASFVLDAERDIPFTLAMIDELADFSDPSPQLAAAVMRDGFGEAGEARVDSLQRALLSHRGRFSSSDFAFLGDRISATSRALGVEAADFDVQRSAPPGALIPVPDPLSGPALLLGGTWYAAPRSAGRAVGIELDLPTMVGETEREMHERALLGDEDHLQLPPLSNIVSVAALPLVIESPRFAATRRAAQSRFWLKTTFTALSAAFALILVALAGTLQERARRFVELKSDFVATVSHELRTPLASIRLMAETVQRKTRGLATVKDYPERIIRDIDELTFLVENILSFNRLDKGRWTPRRGNVSPARLIAEVHDEVGWYGFDDVELETHGLDGIVLHADRELLKLLLRNLAKNACNYNERRPIRLTFRGHRSGPDGRWILEVTDNGVGIAPEDRRRVFEDFQRGPKERARGSGLGLSICRRTMHAHGGDITITSTGPEGTTFALSFPGTMVRTRA